MKQIFCTLFVLLLFLNSTQAEEDYVVELKGLSGSLCAAPFSPDEKKMVLAHSNGTIFIVDAETGKELKKWKGHGDVLMSAIFSPDGKKIATAGYDGLRIWDAESGNNLKKLSNNGFDVAYSPDGKKVAMARGDGGSEIFDAESGMVLTKLIQHRGAVKSIAFSPDGKKVATAGFDGTTKIWDVDTGKELKKLVVWDSERGAKEQDVDAKNPIPVYAAVFSPDGKKIVTVAGAVAQNVDRRVIIWDAESGEELRKVVGHKNNPGGHQISVFVHSVAFSPDGKKFVTASGDGTARIWDTEMGKELQQLGRTDSFAAIYTAVFSRDGKKVVTSSGIGGGENLIRIWDWERVPPPYVRLPIMDF